MLKTILCTDCYGALGYEGDLIYHISKDLKRFKELTKGQSVVMGRKTLESLPNQYLEGRTNYVLTRNENYQPKDSRVVVVHDLKKLTDEFRSSKKKDLYVIGGAELYENLPYYPDVIHLTMVLDYAEHVDTSVDLPDMLGLYYDLNSHQPRFVQYKTTTHYDEKSELFYHFIDYVNHDRLKDYHKLQQKNNPTD